MRGQNDIPAGHGEQAGIHSSADNPTSRKIDRRASNSDNALDGIPADIAFLHRNGISIPVLRAATLRGLNFNVPAARVLIAHGVLSEENYYRIAAQELNIDFAPSSEVSGPPVANVPSATELEKMTRIVSVATTGDGHTKSFHIVPDMARRESLDRLIDTYPSSKNRLRITTRTANRHNIIARISGALLRRSKNLIVDHLPDYSARTVMTVKQAIVLLLSVQALAILAFFGALPVVQALHVGAAAFYLGCVGLRLYASLVGDILKRRPKPVWLEKVDRSKDSSLPRYSVLVALYDEENQITDLIAALARLDWPKERLDIKLICEADDEKTLAAVRHALNQPNRACFSLVEVPAAKPRTKPKALSYALALCNSEYVVIYDAEDRPDAQQLRQAYRTFQNGDDKLACLQAPLIIHNYRENWLASLFAIEYSALFDGLLPALAKHRLPLPLGGTSNHFKRNILEQVGGWDPYNVTEDADLGIRLARFGYHCATVSRPTYEEAPIDLDVWLKQRTRWFKGWLQTWLVHMRNPVRLTRDLGWVSTLIFHLMITGMIISALIHPLLVYYIAAALWRMVTDGFASVVIQPLFWLDVATVLLGYLAFGRLAWLTLTQRGLTRLRRHLWMIPVYWFLLSVAAWRAVWHLMIRPHEWEKTPHRQHTVSFKEQA